MNHDPTSNATADRLGKDCRGPARTSATPATLGDNADARTVELGSLSNWSPSTATEWARVAGVVHGTVIPELLAGHAIGNVAANQAARMDADVATARMPALVARTAAGEIAPSLAALDGPAAAVGRAACRVCGRPSPFTMECLTPPTAADGAYVTDDAVEEDRADGAARFAVQFNDFGTEFDDADQT